MLSFDWRKYLIFLLVAFLVVALLVSGCSPAKKIQKVDDAAEKIEALKARFERERLSISSKAIEDYVKNNPLVCPPIEIDLDSLCPPVDCPTNSNATDYVKDTTIKYLKGDNVYIRGKIKLVPTPDLRKINLLSDSLLAYKLINASLNTANAVNQLAYNETIAEKNFKIKNLKGFKWLFWLLLAGIVLSKGYSFVKNLKKIK